MRSHGRGGLVRVAAAAGRGQRRTERLSESRARIGGSAGGRFGAAAECLRAQVDDEGVRGIEARRVQLEQ
jgi:hypothetical protein